MTQSPTKKRIIKPPLDRFGGVRVVQRRIRKSEVIEHNKDNVAQELIDIATANIDEIMDWDDEGNVTNMVRKTEANRERGALNVLLRVNGIKIEAPKEVKHG